MIHQLECLRNAKYKIESAMHPESHMTIAELCALVHASNSHNVDINSRVSFFGFNNEFHTVYGKNSVYICFRKWEEDMARHAMKHGATAILSDHQIDNLPCLIVQDVDAAFYSICSYYYCRRSLPSVVVAGSIGKTTTTQMVEAVMKEHYHVHCAPINGNNFRYVGFLLQHIPAKTQWLVQEVDESFPQNASLCSRVLQPKIALITNIDKSHISELGGELGVETAITDITKGMCSKDHVIINLDDEKSAGHKFSQIVHTVSLRDSTAECYADHIRSEPEKTVFTLHHADTCVEITLNCPGQHNIYNAMMAYLSGILSGVPVKEIVRGLKKYRPLTVRQTIYHSLGRTLYVDCFNASARSVSGAIQVIDRLPTGRKGRRILVLGDIAEIDGYEAETYRTIGEAILQSKSNLLVTYGNTSKMIWDSLSQSHIPFQHFEHKNDLKTYIRKLVHPGDVVLFKGSGVMKMEYIVRELYPCTLYLGMLPYYFKRLRWMIITL